MFESTTVIDVDALENFVLSQKDALLSSDNFSIDLSDKMVNKQVLANKVRGPLSSDSGRQSQNQGSGSASEPSASESLAGNSRQASGSSESSLESKLFAEMAAKEELKELVESSKHIYSSQVVGLNEAGSEYFVQTLKHFFDSMIIVEYVISNTLEDQILSNVRLVVSSVESAYNLTLHAVSTLGKGETIKYGEKKSVYAIFSKQNCEHPFPLAKISQKLVFQITEIDVDSKDELGSYEEDYALDDSSIAVRDYIRPYVLPPG